jgi:hypothetical protein
MLDTGYWSLVTGYWKKMAQGAWLKAYGTGIADCPFFLSEFRIQNSVLFSLSAFRIQNSVFCLLPSVF